MEAAEALVRAERYNECLTLCDEFLPILSVADSTHDANQSVVNGSKSFQELPQSPGNLFSSPESDHDRAQDAEITFTPVGKNNSFNCVKSPGKSDLSSVLTPRVMKNLCDSSRKRKRTVSYGEDLPREDSEKCEPLAFVAARIHMCHTDCLVGTAGYTEDAMHSVKR